MPKHSPHFRRPLVSPLASRFAPLLACAALTGCTGTVEETLRPFLLVATEERVVSLQTPAQSQLALSPVAQRSFEGPVAGVAALSGADRAVVAAGSEIVVVNSALELQGQFPAPSFSPCWSDLFVSPNQDRVAALSACESEPLRAAVYSSAGVLLWERTLPPPTPSDLTLAHIAVRGDTAWVVRPNLSRESEVLALPRDAAADSVPQAIATVAAPVRALAVRGTGLLLASDDGVSELQNGSVSEPFLAGKGEQLLFRDGLLAVSLRDSATAQLSLVLRRGNESGSSRLFAAVQAMALGSDGYLYTLQNTGTVARTDITRLRENLRTETLRVPERLDSPKDMAVLVR